MSSLCRAFLLCGTLLTSLASAQERTRNFTDNKCQYTLADDRWQWAENPAAPNVLCMATNDAEGLILMVVAIPGAQVVPIDEKLISEFDKGATRTGLATKRGGRITTFKGLPCYQFEGTIDSDTSSVVRVMYANNICYQIQLLGGSDPVEMRPDFESIMNGFQFAPPSAETPPKNTRQSLAWAVGFIVIIVVVALFIQRRNIRQTQSGSTVGGLVCLYLALFGFNESVQDLMGGEFAGKSLAFIFGDLCIPVVLAIVGLFLLLKRSNRPLPQNKDPSQTS